jgi:putative aldouronate transport system substrate-binding protein
MKTFVKRLKVLAVLGFIVPALLLSACSGEESSAQQENREPESKETLRILTGVAGGKNPEEHELFVKEIEEKTGMNVEMEKPPSNYDEKLLSSISSGEKYDLIYLTKDLMDVLVDQGALMKLNKKIKQSEVLSDPDVINSGEWETISYEDGGIYGVFNKSEGGTMPIIRQDWLGKLNLEQPHTLKEFYKVLKAFSEQDPDGNGKDDTYGLSTAGLYDIQGFMSAAGVKYKYVIDENGNRTIPYATEAAIPVYKWLNKLYEEGILDPNFATNDTAKMREMFLTDRVGMVTYWDAWVGLFNNIRYQENPKTDFDTRGIPGVPGSNGVMLRRGDPSLWAIPVNAEHPEMAVKFLEFWHSKEGNMLSTLGIESHDYVVENGEYKLTETGKKHGMDHGVIFPNNNQWENPVGLLPGVEEANQIILESNATVELSTEDWPDAEKVVTNYAFQAIMGKMPVEKAVRQMNEELKAAGLIN